MLRVGDRVTFTADVLWRLYRREERLPVFRVLHINEGRKSVLVRDANGHESALSLELLVPTQDSWDSARRMLRLAQTPEQLIGFMRWHAEGCSGAEHPTRAIAVSPAPDGIHWENHLQRAAAASRALALSVCMAFLAIGLLLCALACPVGTLLFLLLFRLMTDSA
jgi:hypothetical protein